jgi:glycosyltransferase involved in cell wall biosynthesis
MTPENDADDLGAADATPMISVIIPVYNGMATLGACIDSIRATGYAPLEIIPVDDRSTDGTPAELDRLHQDAPDVIRPVKLEENRGPAYARNAGAATARGDYLFFVDCDTEMEPDTLRRFIERMNTGEADAVSGVYHERPLNGGWSARYKAAFNNYMFSRNGVFAYEVFNGAVAGIKRSVFEETGGYDGSIRWGMDYENEEFGHRLEKSHRLLADPAVQVRHHFPGFSKMTAMYFKRVSQWMGLFVRRWRFEKGGPANAGSGVASLSVPAAMVSWIATAFVPWAIVPALLFTMLYLRGYGGFLCWLGKRQPGFLPAGLLLNLWCSCVISLGAVHGAVTSLWRRFAGGKGATR